MDNAQKAIMIGVGLFITIIIISAVLLIVNLGTGLVDDATGELGTMSTSLQNQILQSYDNKVLSGVQVRSAIQQYLRSTDLTVVLCSITTDTDKFIKPEAIVGNENFDPTKITASVSSTSKTLTGKENGITKADIASISGFNITATDYKTAATSSVKETSMAPFNAIANAGSTYINTASNYRSYILRVASTDTIVGIVFVPYD